MIASLAGTLQQKSLGGVVVEVGGVGYQVMVSSQTIADLPQEGEQVRLLCHTHVREDALQLFGFAEQLERRAFELLIAVSGVGPKLALTILSGMPLSDLIEAMASADHRRLQTIPGVGKRTAERLVVELKDRFGKLAAGDGKQTAGRRVGPGDEVMEALVGLGYKRGLAEKAVQQVEQRYARSDATLEAERLLRESLGVISEL